MSEQQDEASKTEEPTQKRIQKAEEEGQFAQSREIQTWASLAGILVVIGVIMPWVGPDLMVRLSSYISESHRIPVAGWELREVMIGVIGDFLGAVWMPLVLFMVLGVIATVGQIGFHVTLKTLQPKLDQLNPIAGFQKTFGSVSQLVELAKSIAKLLVIAVAAVLVLWPVMDRIQEFTGTNIRHMLQVMYERAVLLLIIVLIIMLIVAVIDYMYQSYNYTKKLRMTKQEVKDEHKQAEGDPVVKGRLRQLRIEKARQRIMAAVPKADVVVTNPTHYAVALAYEAGSAAAPVVVAKGIDQIALNIRRVAEEHDVPIIENPPLARALHDACEIDQEIPPDHYRAVAEIISYVYRLRGRAHAG